MSSDDLALMAHLMRRAGFGATRDELEAYVANGYEATVEDLLHPRDRGNLPDDVIRRYHVAADENLSIGTVKWMYRMITTRCPLEEKLTLFWHGLFATSYFKGNQARTQMNQFNTFRRHALGSFRDLLVQLSRDPAMIFWLDNNDNHAGAINENYGRELLELFSMGEGNYTAEDVKECARAFTGWTFRQPIPLYPHGLHRANFLFRDDDHDYSEKTFLGETGRFNGEDIIDIIVKQPATARFISRHLYNFFVADEPQVPSWNDTPPQDPEAIDTMVKAYFDSNGEIRSVLQVLFNSDFFKEARFKKVKSPTELVAGIIRLVRTYRFPEPGMAGYAGATTLMGQMLMNPPTVEGWHTGKEWIDGGTLNQRVNFAVKEVGDPSKPGVRAIIDGVGSTESSDELVDRCLDLIGQMDVSGETHDVLVEYANGLDEEEQDYRVVRMLQQIVATREFQFA